ncbi:LacI family DNA-binding transcriptional regulator [uncultured Tenacibaculum sp.]|uniref:LacI family DNA-binding transcriptional regulator n=1 Tax=uncultured Tenacibaculum sp. TaxID=174713 RepID=UPI002630EBEF|nr:LacI family DNA-binding transcriptional regulator [uncultured Tenacibaculum sp.]
MKKNIPTLKQIAENLELSVSTISRALNNNGSISDLTKKKVIEEAKRLNYVPNIIAKNFRDKRTKTIGVIVPNLMHSFTGTILKGILLETERIKYKTIICETNDNIEKEKELLNRMLEFGVDGILMSLSKFTTNLSPLLKVLEKKPIILFDKASDKIPCTQIVTNEVKGAFNAVEHLINIGKKRIAIIKEKQGSFNSEKRFIGYLKALDQYRYPLDETLIFDVSNTTIEEGELLGEYIVNLKEKPDAIFCITDSLAIGIIKTLNKYNIVIPIEIAVVGFSNSDSSRVIKPNLTTIKQSGYKIGKLAVKQLIEEMRSEKDFFSSKSIEVNTKLIVRESTFVL